jgi:hypothetical protein
MRSLIASISLLAAVLSAGEARAGSTVTVPVDVGVGPAAYLFTGPIADDQFPHYGLKISLEAVIDQELIRRNQRRIPASYRKMAGSMDEVRYKPSIFIPDALIISPKIKDTGIYGVTWNPLGVGVPLLKGPVRLRVGAGLLLTYAFIYSDNPEIPTTHFVRPGLDLGADLEIPFTKSFLISLGWSSGLYVPQKLGSFGLDMDAIDKSIWHVGQAYLQLHFRFPYSTKM